MRQRYSYRMEVFAGENNTDALTSQAIFGRSGGMFSRLRNYHLVGVGKARKRYGYEKFNANQPAGSSSPIQGLAMYEFGSTRLLVVVAGGQVRVFNEGAGTFTNITGALSLTGGANILPRFGSFNDGTNRYLLSANGTDAPWAYSGSGNAVTLDSISTGLLPNGTCLGLMEFHGYLLYLTANSLAYAAYGSLDWTNGSALDGPRDPIAVGMAQHSRDVALIFYQQRQVYRLEFNPLEGSTWRMLPVDQSEGCISKTSIVTKDGYTYYAGRKGIYRIGDPERGAQYIGRPIESLWNELNRARRIYVTAVNRGEPWNEIMWLVSSNVSGLSTAQNDCLIVWNTQLKGWTVFPVSATSGKLNFNCGVNWVDSSDLPHTVMGGYDGYLYDAFGHALVDTGYTDDGATVSTICATGKLNYGYAGVSGQREIIIDGEFPGDLELDVTVDVGGRPKTKTKTILAGGDLLDVDFILDESVLSVTTSQEEHLDFPADGRYIQTTLEESSTGVPHTLVALDFPHVRKGLYAA